MGPNTRSRRLRAHLSEFNTTQIHLRNPWTVTFWSMMSPGLGYFLQDRTLKALITVFWGIFINIKAKINLAIVYSCLGQFEIAKKVIDTRWFILFLAVYVYGIWDGYRGSVDINKQYILADMEDARLTPFTMASLDVNFLDRRSPWVAVIWSAFMPGLGYLYLHKVIAGIFMVAWSIVILYSSHCLQAIHLMMAGFFSESKDVLDVQWFLFFPPTYTFVIYDCYVAAVENNKLFKKEQSQFLREQYQMSSFKMPIRIQE